MVVVVVVVVSSTSTMRDIATKTGILLMMVSDELDSYGCALANSPSELGPLLLHLVCDLLGVWDSLVWTACQATVVCVSVCVCECACVLFVCVLCVCVCVSTCDNQPLSLVFA